MDKPLKSIIKLTEKLKTQPEKPKVKLCQFVPKSRVSKGEKKSTS